MRISKKQRGKEFESGRFSGYKMVHHPAACNAWNGLSFMDDAAPVAGAIEIASPSAKTAYGLSIFFIRSIT